MLMHVGVLSWQTPRDDGCWGILWEGEDRIRLRNGWRMDDRCDSGPCLAQVPVVETQGDLDGHARLEQPWRSWRCLRYPQGAD
jgi:hypothetical protein